MANNSIDIELNAGDLSKTNNNIDIEINTYDINKAINKSNKDLDAGGLG